MPAAAASAQIGSQKNSLRYWKSCVAAFLIVWSVLIFGFGYTAILAQHWPMSIVMVLGSLVAGSTPMGGGTVAFPILVLLFHQPPGDARNFAFIIQALGMTSAMLFMIGRGIALPFRFLAGSTAGAAIGLLAGTFAIAPHFSVSMVKLLFSCLWMSFALLTIAMRKEIRGLAGRGPSGAHIVASGLAAGFIGGVIASAIGVGVEMAVYVVMALVYRSDLRIAIPTAVSAAAIASIEGAALHLSVGNIGREAFYNWLAAAPIVIFGAPTGAYVMTVLPRVGILYFVSGLCVFQFVWTLSQAARGATEWLFVVIALSIATIVFSVLYCFGRHTR